MRTFAQRHPTAAFLTLAYLATALIFAVPLLSTAGIGVIDLELPGVAPFVLLLSVALAAIAFLTALADGRDGVRDLRRRVLRFRVHRVGMPRRCSCPPSRSQPRPFSPASTRSSSW